MVHTHAVILLAVVAGAFCSPQRYYIVPLVSRSYQFDPSGVYRSSFVTGDGARVEESGYLKPTSDGQDQVVAKSGNFAYTSPEGVPVSISWVADETGFHPVGGVIPVAPQPQPPVF